MIAAAKNPVFETGRGHVLALIGICALGALVRFLWIGQEGLWLDEMITGGMALRGEGSFAAVIEATFRGDVHPPLYYLAISAWARLFGTEEFALRAFSALAGSLTAPAALWVLRRHLRPTGLVVLALLFVSVPIVLEASQQARAYPFLILAVTVATGLLLDLVCAGDWGRREGRRLAWLTVVLLLGCWLHYFGLVVALGAGVILLVRWRRHRSALGMIALAGVLGALAILPWLLPHAIARSGYLGAGATWIDPVPWDASEALFFGLFGRPWPLAVVTAAALALAGALLPRGALGPTDGLRLRALAGFAAAMFGIALLGAAVAPSLTTRTVAALAPPLLVAGSLLAQAGLAQQVRWRRIACGAAIALVVAIAGVTALRYASTPKFPQWRESAKLVLAWPACRHAEIATYELYDAITYYLERFAPEAHIDTAELYGDRGVRKFLAFVRHRREASTDCPVVFWGNTSRPGHRRAVAALQREYPELRQIRFRKILLLVEPDAERPSGWRRDGEGRDG